MRRRNVAYIRVANKDDYAVEQQKTSLDYYAEKNGYKIDYYYIDNGFAGTTIDRPQLKQLLRDVKSRKVTDRILFKDITRLGRKSEVISEIERQISKRSVKLVSMNEEDNLKTNIAIMMMKWFVEDDKNRIKKSQELYNSRCAFVTNPYKRGTKEDIKFRCEKTQDFKEQGINIVRFRYKDELNNRRVVNASD